MNVLIFSSYFIPYISGITRYTEVLLTELQKKDQCRVLTFQHDPTLPHQEQHGYTVTRMPYWFRLSKGFISPQASIYFWQETRKADTVIIMLPNGEGLLLALLARLLGKNLICVYQCDVILPPGLGSTVISFLLGITIWLQLALAKHIVTFPDYANSLSWYGAFKSKVTHVLPPIQLVSVDEKEKNRLQNLKKERLWIGFIGRIASEKGVEYLIEAVQIVRQHYPQAVLVLAGPDCHKVVGEASYCAKILEQLKHTALPFIRISDPSNEQLSACYELLDVVVVPSINRTEAFSIAQVEAMLHGVPVVATNLPGIRYPVSHTGMGIPVPPRSASDMAAAIIKILSTPEEYKNEANLSKARHLFSLERTIGQFSALSEK